MNNISILVGNYYYRIFEDKNRTIKLYKLLVVSENSNGYICKSDDGTKWLVTMVELFSTEEEACENYIKKANKRLSNIEKKRLKLDKKESDLIFNLLYLDKRIKK